MRWAIHGTIILRLFLGSTADVAKFQSGTTKQVRWLCKTRIIAKLRADVTTRELAYNLFGDDEFVQLNNGERVSRLYTEAKSKCSKSFKDEQHTGVPNAVELAWSWLGDSAEEGSATAVDLFKNPVSVHNPFYVSSTPCFGTPSPTVAASQRLQQRHGTAAVVHTGGTVHISGMNPTLAVPGEYVPNPGAPSAIPRMQPSGHGNLRPACLECMP